MDFNVVTKNGHIHMTPKNGKYTHIIIFLHGMGDSPRSYESFFSDENVLPENCNIKVILMQSPFLMMNGFPFPSWFSITKFPIDSEKCYNFNEAQKSSQKIIDLIEEEVKLINGKYENIFVGGFSQGACLSLHTGLTYKHLLGGVISLSGALFSQTKILDSNKGLKIFVGHGLNDEVIPYKTNQESLRPIENFPGLCKYSYPNLAHSIANKEVLDLKNFLSKCITGK